MSFLVLDSDTTLSRQLIDLLAESGYRVHGVPNVEAASMYSNHNDVTAVLAPALKSCELFSVLQPFIHTLYFSDKPIDANEMLQCLRAGVTDCLELPLSSEEVISKLDACVARNSARDQVSQHHRHLSHDALEADLQAGQYIQTGLLPQTPESFDQVLLEHRLEPSMLLSGDFVDYFALEDGSAVCYLADVSGHGSSAAFVTVLLKYFSAQLRRTACDVERLQPGEVLTWMNNELLALDIDKHVAMFFACVDSNAGTLTYANAAQFPPAFLARDEGVTLLEQKAKPLGLFPGVQYQSVKTAFPPGARVVAFTDGVLDLLAGESFPDKEKQLTSIVQNKKDMAGIWSQFDLDQLGQDDVSCLLVANNA